LGRGFCARLTSTMLALVGAGMGNIPLPTMLSVIAHFIY
jgi:hypothetical protein